MYGDGGNGADFFTRHTDHITGGIDGDGVKRGGETGGQGADPDTRPTFEASIPVDLKGDRRTFGHGLHLSIVGIGVEISGKGGKEAMVLHVPFLFAEDVRFDIV